MQRVDNNFIATACDGGLCNALDHVLMYKTAYGFSLRASLLQLTAQPPLALYRVLC